MAFIAFKSGTIAICEVVRHTDSYTMYTYPDTKGIVRRANKISKGKEWDLFHDVKEAMDWIMSVQPGAKVKSRKAKIQEDSREWNKRLKNVCAVYAPPIERCSKCGSPKHTHYLCLYCEEK